jgi:signal transduction histidine kinase/ligand-binding sensor domain-containing protein
LPENSATAIAQAPDGYVWFGTFNGLVRFNGTSFTVVTPNTTPGLPDAGIVSLHLDRRDRLWVSTYQGLAVREGERWRSLGADRGWGGEFVRSFAENESGEVLLTSFNGRVFASSGQDVVELPAPPGEAGQGYFGGVDVDGVWWVVQSRFVGRWVDGHWDSRLTPSPELPRDAVGCAPARGGGLWVLLGRDLHHIRGDRVVARRTLPEAPGGVWSLSEDSQGNLWIATHNRGFCQLAPDGTMRRWDAAHGVSDNGRCVFEDREQNVWLGTSGDGLLCLTRRRFQHFDLKGDRKSLVVQSVSPDPDGGIWAATYGRGLFRLGAPGLTNISIPELPDGITHLQSVWADRAGRLWAGTLGGGLRLREASGWRPLPADQTAGGNIIALFEDSDGSIWISGGGEGIARFDGRAFREFGPADGLRVSGVTSLAEDTAGALWVSDGHAVFRRERDRPFTEVKGADGGSLRHIACLQADAEGGMWLGSSDQGLWRWKEDRLSRLDARVGFPGRSVGGIIEDLDGFFWITSGHVLVRVRGSELRAAADGSLARVTVQEFDHNDGLPRADFTQGRQPTCARDTAGRLWFATIKGVAMIDPAGLRLNESPPPVHVEQMSFYRPAAEASEADGGNVAEEVQEFLDGPGAGPVVLPPGSQRIEIRYAGLSYAVPERVRFQVKLEGRDRDWHAATRQRAAEFHDLAPGAYVFRVRAANHDGVWNATGARLAFTVLPYYWQTGWFRFGVALFLVWLGGGVVWVGSRTHVRRALERERLADEMRNLAGRLINAQEDERRRIARELHDDFSQRLALLSVELDLVASAPPDAPTSAPVRLGEMATRVRDLSSEVHRMAYELHPAKLDQLGLVSAARAFTRELSQQSGVRITFEPGAVPRELPPEVALGLYRILQEALQNTIRHSGAAEARVEFRAEPDRILLTVSDTGGGFDVERARREGGLGLSSMQERVRLLHGTLLVTSAPGRGTRIEVSVPCVRRGSDA